MPAAFEADRAVLLGMCGAEVAEPLLGWLIDHPGGAVDIGKCKHLHGAVFQVLLAARPEVVGEPKDAFLREHLAPLLRGSGRG